LDWLWFGLGLVLGIIEYSKLINLNAIYLYRYMAFILEINEYYLIDIWKYKPILNQTITNPKPFIDRMKNLNQSPRIGTTDTKIIIFCLIVE